MKTIFGILSAANIFLMFGTAGGLDAGRIDIIHGTAVMVVSVICFGAFAALAGAFHIEDDEKEKEKPCRKQESLKTGRKNVS